MKVALKTVLLLYIVSFFAGSWFFCIDDSSAESVIVVPDNFPTIQAAINNANEGDTILVKNGTYFERLVIPKSLNVIGTGALSTVIESPGGGHTVEISAGANNVVFEGFTLKGTDSFLWSGIYIARSLNNIVRDNIIVNHRYGIRIYDSSGNILKNNNMSHNKYNLVVWGLLLSHFLHDIDSSNVVNGRPVYYWVNQQNKIVPKDAGYVALVNSLNITVKELNLSNSLAGVLLAYTDNSIITGVTSFNNERGLYLVSSHYNNFVNNNVSGNSWIGISTVSSRGNRILGNIISRNLGSGIRLSHSFPILGYYSESNTISGNTVENNVDGVYLEESFNNKVSDNKIINNTNSGIYVDGSSSNIFWGNTVADNKYNVWIPASPPSANEWYADYPVGGNFWSSHVGVDVLSGANQDQPGSDGIIDVPYVVDQNNIDKYPLATSPHRNPSQLYLQVPDKAVVGTPITLFATLWDHEKNAPLRDSLIYFYLGDNQTKTQIGFSATNASGVAKISYIFSKAGSFRVSVIFEGSQLYRNTSDVKELIVIESRLFWLEGFIVVFVLATLALGFLRWRAFRNRRKLGENE